MFSFIFWAGLAQAQTQMIVLTWYPLPEAEGYRLEIAEDEQFVNKVVSTVVVDTRFAWADFAPKIYYWRVRGERHNGQHSAYSSPGRFDLTRQKGELQLGELTPGVELMMTPPQDLPPPKPVAPSPQEQKVETFAPSPPEKTLPYRGQFWVALATHALHFERPEYMINTDFKSILPVQLGAIIEFPFARGALITDLRYVYHKWKTPDDVIINDGTGDVAWLFHDVDSAFAYGLAFTRLFNLKQDGAELVSDTFWLAGLTGRFEFGQPQEFFAHHRFSLYSAHNHWQASLKNVLTYGLWGVGSSLVTVGGEIELTHAWGAQTFKVTTGSLALIVGANW